MATKLEREVRYLKLYTGVATILCIVLLITNFPAQGDTGRQRFTEIDVERINIVEPDGELKLVISNQDRQHPGMVNGKLIKRDYERPPGMIFFNHKGDEMGGLIFGENGGNGHFGMLTFDKVSNDQTIVFKHLESDNGAYTSGLEIWQRPDQAIDIANAKLDSLKAITDEAERDAAIQAMADAGELGHRRIFLGKWRNNTSAVVMYDIHGNPRIRMAVEPEGDARIEFLDETGKVTHSLP